MVNTDGDYDVVNNHKDIIVKDITGKHNVNLRYTIPHMESRKTVRRWRGAYVKSRPGFTLLLVVLLLVLLLFENVQYNRCTGRLSIVFDIVLPEKEFAWSIVVYVVLFILLFIIARFEVGLLG